MEVASFIVALFAFAFSILAFVKSNKLTKGQVEMQIREMISTAKSRYEDLSIQLSENKENITLQCSVTSALEDVLNAYDEACAKYNDKKVDKARFKKLYINEIRNLVEDENTKAKFHMPQSRFQAIVKVYREWHNLE